MLQDPSAKAWRLVVKGTGDLAFDRLEIEVVTSDVAPEITAREIHDSELVDTMDLSGYADGTAAAGGCHATLHVCIDSDGFKLPKNGNGRFRVQLSVADAAGPLSISGQHGRLAERAVRARFVDRHRRVRLVAVLTVRACGDGAMSPGMLVGRGGIEPPQPKAKVLQTFGLTTCPTDPRWWR